MKASHVDAPLLASLPHPNDEAVLAAARQALLVEMLNVFIVGEEEFHIDACFLALYHQLKLESGLQLHRMMSPKVDEIVELFNTVLADLSIEEARNHQAHERHIIVMPDFGPNAGKEWMACESLVNTFPGANVGMLAFSTMDNHDASALKQLSFKSRNKLMRLTPLDEGAMQRYLADCHQRGVLLEMLPSLVESPWGALAIDVSGLSLEDIPRYSVSDYDESASQLPKEAPEEFEARDDKSSMAARAKDQTKAAREQINWGALFPRIAALVSAGMIILFASAFFLAVAGALHPPIWEMTQEVVKPWLELAMAWVDQLLQGEFR